MACGHYLHQECLFDSWDQAIFDFKFPLKFPIYECQREPQYSEIVRLFQGMMLDENDTDMKQLYDKLIFMWGTLQMPDVRYCPSAHCEYYYIQDSENCHSGLFTCPHCGHESCQKCRLSYHEGQTCEEFRAHRGIAEEDPEFSHLVKSLKWRACTHCGSIVEKTEGCNQMTCRCYHVYCYKCGEPWKDGCPRGCPNEYLE